MRDSLNTWGVSLADALETATREVENHALATDTSVVSRQVKKAKVCETTEVLVGAPVCNVSFLIFCLFHRMKMLTSGNFSSKRLSTALIV